MLGVLDEFVCLHYAADALAYSLLLLFLQIRFQHLYYWFLRVADLSFGSSLLEVCVGAFYLVDEFMRRFGGGLFDVLFIAVSSFNGVLEGGIFDESGEILSEGGLGKEGFVLMGKIEAAKGGVGTPQIPWKLIFKNLELSTSPSLELIFHRLTILKTNLRIFLITGDVILVVFDWLIVVDKVMGRYFDG